MQRFLTLVLLLAVAAAAGYFILWQDKPPEPEPETSASDESPATAAPEADIVAQSIELTQGRAGKIMWSLEAQTGEYDEAAGIIDLDQPRITYYLGEKREKVRLGSKTGTVYQNEDRLILRQGVTGAYDVFDIGADQLDYDGEDGELVLVGDVTMRRSGLELFSQHSVIHLLSKNMTATGNVTAVIRRHEFETDPEAQESEQ